MPRTTMALGEGGNIQVRIGAIGQDAWDALVPEFEDADLCQTWAYGAARWGADNLGHLSLWRNDKVVGAAQVACIRIPGLRRGLAYVKWGPLWRPRGTTPDPEILSRMATALHRHYVLDGGFVLRLMPRRFAIDSPDLRPLLASDGFSPARHVPLYRTVRVDLARPLEVLEAGLKKNWRARLRRARGAGLRVTVTRGQDDFPTFEEVYAEMRRHKSFRESSDLPIYRSVQAGLPRPAQLHIIVCWRDDRPLAAHICSALGDTGVSLSGATAPEGRALGASHLMDWATIEWLKARQVRWYDLGGAGDPSVTRYKLDLAGRNAEIAETIGKWDAGAPLARRLLSLAERGRALYRRLQARPARAG